MTPGNMSSIVWLVLGLLLTAHQTGSNKCDTCKNIVKKFKEGIKKTAKSNFGGGNTNWEEKSLGKYAFSETRLVEIVDTLCADGNECHHLLEEHEETLEIWWFKEFAKKTDTDLHQFFCIDNVKECCPNNTYGLNCKMCPGGIQRPCSGNGNCDGAGTREGKGTCSCNSGYTGELCDECKEGYYEGSKNDTHVECEACHKACKSGCWEAGPKGCDECDSGWTSSEEEGCVDINECDTETSPCQSDQFCDNNEGSYYCNKCNNACNGCSSYGAGNCIECNEGYRQDEGDENCKDIDECKSESGSPCPGEHEECVNLPGSFKCECENDFIKIDDACVPKPKEYVELYEDEQFNGKVKSLGESKEELDDFDKQTSSLKIKGDHKWRFYSEKNFGGTELELAPGNHDLKALRKIGNDEIRSVEKTDIIAAEEEDDNNLEEEDVEEEDDFNDDDDTTTHPPVPPLPVPHMEL